MESPPPEACAPSREEEPGLVDQFFLESSNAGRERVLLRILAEIKEAPQIAPSVYLVGLLIQTSTRILFNYATLRLLPLVRSSGWAELRRCVLLQAQHIDALRKAILKAQEELLVTAAHCDDTVKLTIVRNFVRIVNGADPRALQKLANERELWDCLLRSVLLLGTCSNSKVWWWPREGRLVSFLSCLAKEGGEQLYLEELKKQNQRDSILPILLGVASAAATNKRPAARDLRTYLIGELWPSLCDKGHRSLIDVMAPVLAMPIPQPLSESPFATSFTRLIKRSAKRSLPCLARSVQLMGMTDLSAASRQMIFDSGLLESLSAEATQSVALQLFEALISRMRDPDVLVMSGEALLSRVSAGSRTLRAEERANLIGALEATMMAYAGLDGDLSQNIAKHFFPHEFLLRVGGKTESQDKARAACLHYMGRYVSLVGLSTDEPVAATLKTLEAAIGDAKAPDSVKAAAVSALLCPLRGERSDGVTTPELLSLLRAVISYAESCAPKPVYRGVCLEALLAVALTLDRFDGVTGLGEAALFRKVFESKTSLFNSVPLIVKAAPDEVSTQLDLATVMLSSKLFPLLETLPPLILKEFVSFPPSPPYPSAAQLTFFQTFFTLLVAIFNRGLQCLSFSKEESLFKCRMRALANPALSRGLALAIFQCFQSWSSIPSPAASLGEPEGVTQKGVLFVNEAPHVRAVASAMRLIIRSTTPQIFEDDTGELLFLCACHLGVSPQHGFSLSQNYRMARFVIQQFVLKSPSLRISDPPAPPFFNFSKLPPLFETIAQHSGDESCAVRSVMAAMLRACACLSSKAWPRYKLAEASLAQCVGAICRCIIESLPLAELREVTPYDVQLYFAPEGVLFVEDGVYVPDESRLSASPTKAPVVASKSPANRGGKGAKAGAGQKTKRDIQQEEIDRQSEIRRRLRSHIASFTFLMEAFLILVKVEAPSVTDHVPAFLSITRQLIPCPLVAALTLKALRITASVYLHKSFFKVGFMVPDVSVDLALGRAPQSGAAALREALQTVSEKKALSAPAMSLLQPLVTQLLTFPDPSSAREYCAAALTFLTKQSKTPASNVDVDEAVRGLSAAARQNDPPTELLADALRAACSRDIPEPTVDALARVGEHDNPAVRGAVLRALQVLPSLLKPHQEATAFVAVCAFDEVDEKNRILAKQIGETVRPSDKTLHYRRYLASASTAFHDMAAVAYASALMANLEAQLLSTTLSYIFTTYTATSSLDHRRGLIRFLSEIGSRIPENLASQNLESVIKFVLGTALNDSQLSSSVALACLYEALQNAGLTWVRRVGCQRPSSAGVIEKVSKEVALGVARGLNGGNRATVEASAAVFLGASAQFMNAEDPTVLRILQQLLKKLEEEDANGSSQVICRTIATVLPPLVRSCCLLSSQADGLGLVRLALETALSGVSSIEKRKGGARVLASEIRGLGLGALKKSEVVPQLSSAAEDKRSAERRHGSLLCVENLSLQLGRAFEPFLLQILDPLLNALSDTTEMVRAAAHAAASVTMKQLSLHGVKLVLPTLLRKTADTLWRTKLGSIELLEAMVHCAPSQLRALLPQVVPCLCSAVYDPHPSVRTAAQKAVKTVALMNTSQELRSLTPVLLAALTKPKSESTNAALDGLLDTEFQYQNLEGQSLALISPIVVAALKDRSSEIKKKAAAVAACMVFLCKDPIKHFLPYYANICPHLKETLLDPIPDVRSAAAKAFGTIAKGLGDSNVSELIPWLLEELKESESSVERSGAANGLAEVLSSLGSAKVEALLPSILQDAESASLVTREGCLGLFVFLPSAFGRAFQQFVPQVLPVLLRGLSSESESLRDVAFRGAEVMVAQYGATHSVLLLGPLEEGIFHRDWRIRQLSLSLLGSLIDRLLKHANDSEDLEVLSIERRAFVLSSLYILRSDENPTVRQSATNSWKEVVQNTPKTVKEILPVLLKRLVSNLLSGVVERQRVSALCVGELCAKFPEKTIRDLIPALLEGLKTRSEPLARYGACLAFSELVQSAPQQILIQEDEPVLAAVQVTLCDDSEMIRQAGVQVLCHLLDALGNEPLQRIIRDIITRITQPPAFTSEAADAEGRQVLLGGVKVLLVHQAAAIMPALVDICTQLPIDISKIRLMSCLAAARAAPGYQSALVRILGTLIETGAINLIKEKGSGDEEKERAVIIMKEICISTSALFSRLEDFELTRILALITTTLYHQAQPLECLSVTGMSRLFGRARDLKLLDRYNNSDEGQNNKKDQSGYSPNARWTPDKVHYDLVTRVAPEVADMEDPRHPSERAMLAILVTQLLEAQPVTSLSSAIIKDVLSFVIPMALADPAECARVKATETLSSVVARLKNHNGIATQGLTILEKLVINPFTNTADPDFTLIGLGSRPALDAMYNAFHTALVTQGHEERAVAASGVLAIISHCPPEPLKAIAVKLAGPLVRIVRERTPPTVKAAVLRTLQVLLQRVGPSLRPLMPQLQITFVKATADPSPAVRNEAVSGIGVLAGVTGVRLETLINDLCQAATAENEDPEIRQSLLEAIYDVIPKLKETCGTLQAQQKVRKCCESLVESRQSSESLKVRAAMCVAALLVFCADDDSFADYVDNRLSWGLSAQVEGVGEGGGSERRESGVVIFLRLLELQQKAWVRAREADRVDALMGSLRALLSDAKSLAAKDSGMVAFGRLVDACKTLEWLRPASLELLPLVSEGASQFANAGGTGRLQSILRSLKKLAKVDLNEGLELTPSQRRLLVVPALDALAMQHPGVKLTAERVLFYALQLSSYREAEFLAVLSEEWEQEDAVGKAKFQLLSEYTRRVLSRMPRVFSETEQDENGGNHSDNIKTKSAPQQ